MVNNRRENKAHSEFTFR